VLHDGKKILFKAVCFQGNYLNSFILRIQIAMTTIKGTISNDLLLADSEDIVLGLEGNDKIDAGLGSGGNTLGGGEDNDLLYAGTDDLLLGDTGNDELDASDEGGNNSLYGGKGQDTLYAGKNDKAFGGAGDDTLYAGTGDNTLYGGTGRDRFWIANVEVPTSVNTVADFNAQADQIAIQLEGVNTLAALNFEQTGSDTLIKVKSTGESLAIVKNTASTIFNSNNLIFNETAPLNSSQPINNPRQQDRKTVIEVENLGLVTFSTDTSFKNTQVGGLSGIVYDQAQNRYYAISDDRSSINPARFYTLDINLSDGRLDNGDVSFTQVTTLLDSEGNPFPTNSLDTEGIVLTENGTVYISSEGEARPDIPRLTNPFVNEFSLSGQKLSELPVAEKYFPTQTVTTGIRNNLAFESLTLTPDGRYLYTATENALAQDGPAATLADKSLSRIVKYDLTTGQVVAEFVYEVDKVNNAPIPENSFANNGLVELLAIDNNGTLLALERAFSNGVGNTVKLYEIQTQNATNVSSLDDIFSEVDNAIVGVDAFVTKKLLVDFQADLGIVPDNLEGLALGPVLPDGRQSLIVVSDNNFSTTQTTQFIALALNIVTSQPALNLTPIGTYATGQYNQSAAEIPAYDPASKRLFVVNAQNGKVDVVDASDPTNPTLITSIDTSAFGLPNSVAINQGIVAIAVENADKQAKGQVLFYTANSPDFATPLKALEVGALPDMLTFSPDGKTVLVANEGEPNADYTNDPVGSISIIDLSLGVEAATVKTADFTAFNSQFAQLKAAGVKFKEDVGTTRTVAQDLEPEYIAFSPDSTKAWVTLQEANAIAVIDIATATIESVKPLGFKDYSQPNNALDASDRDKVINIRNWPIFGMYQPDAIASYTANNQTYYITANEGDSRDYDGYSEEARIKDLTLDPTAFPNAAELQKDENIGRLLVTTALGDTDGDGDYDQLYSYGGRSFSIWNSQGQLVYDSGDAFERITAEQFPEFFNASNSNNNFDNRSDDKGPEPEGLVTGKINDRTYAFIGLERIGGVMVYDVTDPVSPTFVQYINNRDFTAATDSAAAKDLGPEGLAFISAQDSPNGKPLLVVANEVSGSTTFYQIDLNEAPINNPPTAVNLSNTVTALAENSNTTGGIKVATINITDDGQGTNVLSLSGADAASFEIRNNELFFIGNSPDFETKNQYDVTVNVDDKSVGETPDASTDFTLNITNLPDQDISDRVSQFNNKGNNLGSLVYNLSDVSGNAKTQGDDAALNQTDALFHNLVGLYQVENANGAILDTLDLNGNGAIDDLLNPGDVGYARTAITNAVNNFVLQMGANSVPTDNTSSSEFGDVLLQGGKRYSPFAIANGGDLIPPGGTLQDGINTFLAQNPNNTAANLSNFMTHAVAYFSFGSANPDGAEHLQNRGNNVFGFEDLPGNLGISDFDFNDAVLRFTFLA
jgi:DNA-binding beta-propeller fold protein YncE